uniref:Uncharacterized protein n=1 Tax=Syphacia muris TaxID=451379 RepID=A0A0N5AA23_9BILA
MNISENPQSSNCGNYSEAILTATKTTTYSNTLASLSYLQTPSIPDVSAAEHSITKPTLHSNSQDSNNMIRSYNNIVDNELVNDDMDQMGYDGMDYY